MADINLTLATALDQHQDSTGTNFGFGEINGTLSRGQIFVPASSGNLLSVGFDRVKGVFGVKVFLDTVTGANIPSHDFNVGQELYSFVIPHPSVVDGFYVYNLPTPLALSGGTKYCFYLAPWDDTINSYGINDYQDLHGVSSGFDEITNQSNTWFNEGGLTLHFATYMGSAEAVVVNEATSLGLTVSVNVSDTVNHTESVAAFSPTLQITLSDSITLTENVSDLLPQLLIAASDQVTVNENIKPNLISNINVSESISLNETIPASSFFTLLISVNDYVAVQDYRHNLSTNPTFETGTTNWFLEGDYSRTNSDSFNGSWSVTEVSTSGFSNFYTNDSGITVLPNKAYTLSFYYKLTITSGSGPFVSIAAITPFGTWIAVTNLLAAASWTREVFTFNTGNNTTVYIRLLNNNSNITAFYDAFLLENTDTALAYFDGSTTNASWDGTANASASTLPTLSLSLGTAFNPASNDQVSVSESIQLSLLAVSPIGKNENILVTESITMNLTIDINQVGTRTGIIIS